MERGELVLEQGVLVLLLAVELVVDAEDGRHQSQGPDRSHHHQTRSGGALVQRAIWGPDREVDLNELKKRLVPLLGVSFM